MREVRAQASSSVAPARKDQIHLQTLLGLAQAAFTFVGIMNVWNIRSSDSTDPHDKKKVQQQH